MTVAHVTGAARGIGKAIALRLAHDGHDVAVSDLPLMKSELDVTRKELEDVGVRAAALTGDVSDPESVHRLVADTAEELGSLDVFVANAGIAQTKALLDVTPEEYDKVHAVNGRGVFLCYTGDDYRAVIALMAQGHYDTTGWVDTIPMSGVLEQGFEELRAGRKMKLLVDPTA